MDSLGTVSSIPQGLYTCGSAHRPWSVHHVLLMSLVNCPMGLIPQKVLECPILSTQSDHTNRVTHSHDRGS